MRLHADLGVRAMSAPRGGVPGQPTTQWLERGEAFSTRVEVLPPGASLNPASGQEDRFVLGGAVTVEDRAYPAGTLLRRTDWPSLVAGEGGARIFCKRRLRPSASRPEATRSSLGEPFAPTPTPGLTALVLLADESRVVLLRFAPGTELAPHDHPRGEEFYVWRGSLSDEHGQYVAGSWVRQPPGSRHCVRSPSGCVLLTYSGHLVAL